MYRPDGRNVPEFPRTTVGAIIASDESDIAPMRAARESPVLNLAAILFPIEGMQEAVE
jgi:hypothetical protein